MIASAEGTKAKTARRVVEVLEYFDDHHRHATVMDIVRRYDRPQSSTSELLASLVELGLLYKDAATRCYSPTPRAAILGSLSQPGPVRDGTLATLIDRLAAQTGLGVALVGMVGRNAQLFRWQAGARFQPAAPGGLAGGAQERLCDSAAGRLLLATQRAERREGLLRRYNAEAAEGARFDVTATRREIDAIALAGAAIGGAGFGSDAEIAAVLLPPAFDERPMALGLVYRPDPAIDPASLVELLRGAAMRCVPDEAPTRPQSIPSAAA